MLAASLFAAFLIIQFAPDTFLGRALRRGLVDWPAERLSRIRRRTTVAFTVIVVALLFCLFVLKGDSLAIFGMALPDLTAGLAAIEASTYLDILMGLGMVASRLRLRGALDAMRARLGRPQAVSRARNSSGAHRRRPRIRRPAVRKPDNDDGEDHAAPLPYLRLAA